MIWLLVRKEILAHLLTLRLAVAFGVTAVLVSLVTFINSIDFSQRMEEFRSERRDLESERNRATVWAQVPFQVALPPQPVSLFALGIESWVGNSISAGVRDKNEAPGLRSTLSSNFMKTLVQIDFASVVAIVLSFLAVALGFDGICGEREDGTLRQLLSYPVSRGQVVVGKLVGGCLALWLPLTIAWVVAVLIAVGNEDVAFTARDWLRLVTLLVLSCLFLAQVYALSLMVSCWVRRSATALILCLFGWLGGGVMFMDLAPFIGEFGMRETPFQVFIEQTGEVGRRYQADLAEWDERNPSPGRAHTEGLVVDGVLRFARPEGYEWLARQSAHRVERQIELEDAIYDLRWGTAHWERAEQARFADRWAFLSPLENYRVLTYRLARTTMDDKLLLGRASQRFRETLMQHLRGRGAFGRRWITDDPPDQTPMIADTAAVTPAMLEPGSDFMRERLAWARAENERIDAARSRTLDLTGLPQFDVASGYRSLPASLAGMVPGVAVLILTAALAVMLTVFRFLRYEPHG